MNINRLPSLFSCQNVLLKPLLSIVAIAGFVAAAGGAESTSQASPFTSDISLSEIMESIVMPSADVLWNAVTYDVTPAGEVVNVPETDEEWAKLRWSAVNLATATNLLLIPGMPVAKPSAAAVEPPPGELGPEQVAKLQKDNWQSWIAHAAVLHAAALQAITMIDTKNVDGLNEVGGTIDTACEGCHLQFWYPGG